MRFQDFFSKINLSKIKSNGKTNTNKNLKTYLFFLVFTAFLWFALQFSKNYSREIEFDIEYVKSGTDKLIEPSNDSSISLLLEGNGFQLLRFYIFNNTLRLDPRKAQLKSASEAYLTGNKMLNIFKSSLNYDGQITYASVDTLRIKFSKIVSKQVPVKIVDAIEYTLGYTSFEGVQSPVENVKVLGPETVLDTLKFIKTKELKLFDVNKDYQGFVSLEIKKEAEQLKIEPKKIPISIKVDKLTEGEFSLPIQILNVPVRQRVQLFPKEVTVVFGVALKDYPKLKASDFKVTVDFKDVNPRSSTLGVKLHKAPKLVFNARLSEKEVQYIVIK